MSHRRTRSRQQVQARRSALPKVPKPHKPPEAVRAGSAGPASGRAAGTQAVGRIPSRRYSAAALPSADPRPQVTHHVRQAPDSAVAAGGASPLDQPPHRSERSNRTSARSERSERSNRTSDRAPPC